MSRITHGSVIAIALFCTSFSAQAQLFQAKPKPPALRPVATPLQPQRKASDLIHRPEPVKINQSILSQATPDSVHVVVSIPKQRALLMVGEQIAADAPISSGKKGHGTPTGKFSVLEKDPNHHSSIYGDFRDSSGRIVRAGVSAHIDSAPSGTHFTGAEMKWFMRLTGDGVGMHIGILPGYPASHGCVRMSSEGAKLFYDHVKVGTPVAVGDY
jgi:lipoprotein-anchoring transpeptidase ErfK/SrfK